MSVAENTEHVDQGLALLITQLVNKPNFAALLTVFLDKVQELESVYMAIQTERELDNAEGVQLDVLGSIVGVSRELRDDETYRLVIRAQIRANFATGVPADLFDVFEILLGGEASIEIREYPPAAFTADVGRDSGAALSVAQAYEIVRLFRRLRAGGVDASLIYSLEADEDTFLFSDSTEDDSTTQGLADADEDDTTGGVLAEIES